MCTCTYCIHIQCVPEKRKPINRVNFSENCNDLSEKVYTVTKFSLSSFFWHQLQDVLAMHEQARTISNGDVKNDLRRMGIWGLNGVCHVSEQRDVLKRHSLAFLLSLLSCFFCLDSLFWHGLASLNLVISTQRHYSAQIVFDMHEFNLFPFIHALRYHYVFGIKWKKRKCPW